MYNFFFFYGKKVVSQPSLHLGD